jgi:hypothetical protein
MTVPSVTFLKRIFPSSSPSVKKKPSGFNAKMVAAGLLSVNVFVSLNSCAEE